MGIVGILATISVGLFFYRLRCRHQFRYGLVEVAVSLVVIYRGHSALVSLPAE
jgi:hypothetical protein